MSLSLYDITIPPFIRALRNLSAVLKKGEAHGGEALVNKRLVDDMQDLAYQIQRVSDTSKGVVARLTGRTEPMADTETTFADLYARLDKTIAVLEAVKPEEMAGKEGVEVTIRSGAGPVVLNGTSYVLAFAIPNFYFHVTTAYAILRKEGVPLGKDDYLGGKP